MKEEWQGLNRQRLVEELRRAFDQRSAEVLTDVLERVLAQLRPFELLREDISGLRQAVEKLARAQAQAEERLERVEAAVERLAEAQVRTESRLQRAEERLERVEAAVERLAEAQARAENRLQRAESRLEKVEARLDRVERRLEKVESRLDRVERRLEKVEGRLDRVEAAVERLAQAQTKTEERLERLEAAVEQLSKAQAKTEERLERLEAAVEQLSKAQARTETALQRLVKQVGGLSETVGGDIEDIAYIVVHDVLEREYGWEVGVLERTWKRWDDREEEINLFGKAVDPARPKRTIWIVGEAKHNLTLREVERFTRQLNRVKRHLEGEIFPVCFCYRARPEVQQRIKTRGIYLVFSYGKLVRP